MAEIKTIKVKFLGEEGKAKRAITQPHLVFDPTEDVPEVLVPILLAEKRQGQPLFAVVEPKKGKEA